MINGIIMVKIVPGHERRIHRILKGLAGIRKMYLLFGDFLCECEGESGTISKIYVYGTGEESHSASQVNKSVANARLKMDYQRLKDAKIKFVEQYF